MILNNVNNNNFKKKNEFQICFPFHLSWSRIFLMDDREINIETGYINIYYNLFYI